MRLFQMSLPTILIRLPRILRLHQLTLHINNARMDLPPSSSSPDFKTSDVAMPSGKGEFFFNDQRGTQWNGKQHTQVHHHTVQWHNCFQIVKLCPVTH